MQSWYSLSVVSLLASGLLCGQSPSPATARVAFAEKRVAANVKSWEAYNDLAFALCRRARDTGDVADYEKADAALGKSLGLSPGNYEARKLGVQTLLGKHEFARAQTSAVELNRKVPDDIAVWGSLVDVHVALGNYSEAERAAQWILDLRRGSTLGFVKAAGLREIFGDPEGAAEFYEEAGKRTARSDLDEQSWLLVQDARQYLNLGKPEHAEELLKQAMSLFPESQHALQGLAAVRASQGKFAEAAALLERRYRAVNHPGNLYEWAEALDRSGQKQPAAVRFQEFETKASPLTDKAYNWNRELIFYNCDYKPDPAQGLLLAKRENSARHDWAASESLAWALYRNGRYVEAEKQMLTVSAIGVRTPEHLCRAAQVAQKAGDSTVAQQIARELADAGVRVCQSEAAGATALQAAQ